MKGLSTIPGMDDESGVYYNPFDNGLPGTEYIQNVSDLPQCKCFPEICFDFRRPLLGMRETFLLMSVAQTLGWAISRIPTDLARSLATLSCSPCIIPSLAGVNIETDAVGVALMTESGVFNVLLGRFHLDESFDRKSALKHVIAQKPETPPGPNVSRTQRKSSVQPHAGVSIAQRSKKAASAAESSISPTRSLISSEIGSQHTRCNGTNIGEKSCFVMKGNRTICFRCVKLKKSVIYEKNSTSPVPCAMISAFPQRMFLIEVGTGCLGGAESWGTCSNGRFLCEEKLTRPNGAESSSPPCSSGSEYFAFCFMFRGSGRGRLKHLGH
eukprot:752422-Hanusia_phi.AAC.4